MTRGSVTRTHAINTAASASHEEKQDGGGGLGDGGTFCCGS